MDLQVAGLLAILVRLRRLVARGRKWNYERLQKD